MALAAIAYPLLWSGAFRSLLGSGLLLSVFLLALLLSVFWRFVAHYGAPFAGYFAITRAYFPGTTIIAQKVKCLIRIFTLAFRWLRAHRLAQIDRLQRRHIVGIASLETLPGELGQVARPPRAIRRRGKDRPRTQ
jgi:hypothetical protein